jgi:hypothetical protein
MLTYADVCRRVQASDNGAPCRIVGIHYNHRRRIRKELEIDLEKKRNNNLNPEIIFLLSLILFGFHLN